MRLRLLVFLALAPCAALAQFTGPATPFVQAGAGFGPGVGLQAGLAVPSVTLLTQEGMLYADYRLGSREEQRLLLGFGVGGSVRVLRGLLIVTDFDPGPFELDLGFRFGPSFAFSFVEATAETKVRQFRLFADPFVRGVYRTPGGWLVFGELGTQQGNFRLGAHLPL